MSAGSVELADRFRDTIGRFVSGVTVITACWDGVPYGTTVSALTSVSVDPPTLLVCLNRESATGRAIEATGRFVVNVLAHDQRDLAHRFATKGDGKFAGLPVADAAVGEAPVLAGVLAALQCRVEQRIPAATHAVLIATVESLHADDGAPLAYFRGAFHCLAPAE